MIPVRWRWLLDGLWLALLAVYILAGVRLVPLHGDESAHVFMTRDYVYQFIERDLTRIRYSDPPIDPLAITEQEFRLLNGTVHKYLAGLFWHLAGYDVADLNRVWWTWGADLEYNRQNGALPPDDLLMVTRLASALLMAAGVVVIFGIGRMMAGRGAAYAMSALYALHPVLLLNGRRSMLEGSLMLFSLLTVLAALAWLRAEGRARWAWSLVLGLSAGMAVASKHPGVFTVLSVFITCSLYTLSACRHDRSTLTQCLGGLALAGVTALLVFYALNPAWWGDPLRVLSQALTLRARLLDEQTAAFGAYESVFAQVAGFAAQAITGAPQYYEAPDWAAYIADQIAAYEAMPLTGLWLGESLPGRLLLMVLWVAGAIWWARQHDASTRWLLAGWLVGVGLLTALLTPLDWQRYYLPALLPLVTLAGLGMAPLLTALITRLQRRTSSALDR